MRNFLRIAQGVDVAGLRHAVEINWDNLVSDLDLARGTHGHHSGVESRTLRGPWLHGLTPLGLATSIPCVNYPAMARLPQARRLIFALMAQVEGEQLGRVLLTRAAPGSCVETHSDFVSEGPPRQTAIFYNRYHLVLASAPGSVFACGDESVYMGPGEVWWFDNVLPHSVD